jgi:hypothetical protein
MSKGISVCVSVAITILIVIGIMAFFYWMAIARFFQLHVIVEENEVERRTINMANVLLSYENLTSSSSGKSMRGVFDSEKLNKFATFLSKADTENYVDAVTNEAKNAKELNIGYPNTYTVFSVVDLESCSEEKCDGWVGVFKGPFDIDATYAKKFIDCLATHFDVNIGSVFRGAATVILIPKVGFVLGPVFSLWQPWDLAKCGKEAMTGLKEIFFGYSSVPTISSGYPVLIKYPDSLHIGRLYVGVWQWA